MRPETYISKAVKGTVLCMVLLSCGHSSQDSDVKQKVPNPPSQTFQSPVDYEISLAGNFGEPRPNHFHGGIDIKTEGREGKHIYAIADGYVSRITMGLFGFGNAVYITHPTGQTSVYCHLKAFSPRIKAALRRYQYRHETCIADARLTPLDVPVSQGQFIALSGNTGHSTAPHLHLELHDTRTWEMLDPYPYLNHYIADTVAPQAHGLMAVPQSEADYFNESSRKQTFGIASHHIDRRFTAWGRVGFALWANDYMQGSYNHYGIHETILNVDGHQVFRSLVDSIPVSLNRMVNSWGDYDHWLHYHTWYIKSFAEPGNTLPMLKTDSQRGVVTFNEERDYQLEYILHDYKGNEARYTFTVTGRAPVTTSASADTAAPTALSALFRWNQTNSFSLPGMQLIVPYGLLTSDIHIRPTVNRRPGYLSDAYSFSPTSLPLVGDAEISIFARTDNYDTDSLLFAEADPTKFYISCNGKFSGGSYERGWVSGRIRELASTCLLEYDDCPPDVRPLSLTAGRLLLALSDRQSGISTFKAWVDGRFVVFDAVEKTSNVVCHLSETPIKPTGKSHHLKFMATDNRHNTREFEADFIY